VELLVFVLASAAALVAGATVLVHRNPLICALALVANLLSVAVLFVALGAQFVATLQVILYAGAIMVLIVFVIMLLGLPREAQAMQRVSRAGTVVALIGGVALLAAILRAIAAIRAAAPGGIAAAAGAGAGFGTARWVARSLFSTYYYPFEVISLVLVAAMAGAILLAKRDL